ncbi:mycothiol system anti-sigma-R factor [Cellulomonas sp. Marseille-Q8402]
MTGWDAAEGTPATDEVEEGCGPNCEQALGRLFAYVDRELESGDAAQVRAHIEDCRPCLDEMAVETMLKELVKRCCQEQAPADLRVKIHAQLTTLRVTRTV